MSSLEHGDLSQEIDSLGERIMKAKTEFAQSGYSSPETERMWTEMSEQHAKTREKLARAHSATDDMLQGVKIDIETLSLTFARWLNSVEKATPGSIGARQSARDQESD
jgi:predicted  nucleic acid-binding Zn-ribbon protein